MATKTAIQEQYGGGPRPSRLIGMIEVMEAVPRIGKVTGKMWHPAGTLDNKRVVAKS